MLQRCDRLQSFILFCFIFSQKAAKRRTINLRLTFGTAPHLSSAVFEARVGATREDRAFRAASFFTVSLIVQVIHAVWGAEGGGIA